MQNTQEEVMINSDSSQYLTFMLNGEEYGVDILKVQGIQGWTPVTSIPNTPEFVLGVINLRGEVVPIVDLRKRFNLVDVEFGPTTVVIVVKINDGDGGNKAVGLVVDAVSEVYSVSKEDIRLAPGFGSTISTEYIKGLVTIQDNMVILLEIDSLVAVGVLETVPDNLVV